MEHLDAEPFLLCFRSLVEDVEDIMEMERGTLSGDYEVISRSVKSRGLGVLFLNLPSACKNLERSLDAGEYISKIGDPFTKNGYPSIFTGLYAKIFTDDWVLLDEPDLQAIRCLRQILRIFKKFRVACPDFTLKEKIREFREIELGLPLPNLSWGADYLRVVDRYPCLNDLAIRINGLFGDQYGDGTRTTDSVEASELLRDLSSIQSVADLLSRSFIFREDWFNPKHGPGAVSEAFGDSKYEFPSWPMRLEAKFPFDLYGMINHADWTTDEHNGTSMPAKLIDVPKDFNGPRLIASEPISSQFIQQGILGVLRKCTRNSVLRNCIDFKSQEPSRVLALTSSLDRSFSTIDLSSASDRLSCAVVECIFRRNYSLLEIFNAARTPEILYPDGSISAIKKFAAQGAAFTFPVQSITYAIICIGVVLSANPHMRLTDASKVVRVFGDDMIVPTDVFTRVCKVLEAISLKVNESKSFSKGYFRESCGMDAYKGEEVTPSSILTFFNTRDPNSTVSVIECSNNLYKKGFIRTSLTLQETIPQSKRKLIPWVGWESTVLGFVGHGKSRLQRRYNALLHRDEVRILVVENKVTRTYPDGRFCLFQWFIEEPRPDVEWHPGEVRSVKARYRLRWVPSNKLGHLI